MKDTNKEIDFTELMVRFVRLETEEFDTAAEPFVVKHYQRNIMKCADTLLDRMSSENQDISPALVVSVLDEKLKKLYLSVGLTGLLPHMRMNLNTYSPVFPPDGVTDESEQRVVPEQNHPFGDSIMPGFMAHLPYFEYIIMECRNQVIERFWIEGVTPKKNIVDNVFSFLRDGLLTAFNEGSNRAEVLFHSFQLPRMMDPMFQWYIRAATDAIINRGDISPAPNLPCIIQCRLEDSRPEIRTMAAEARDRIAHIVDFNRVGLSIHMGPLKTVRNTLIENKNIRGLVDLGIMCGRNNCFGEAIILLSDALRIDPDDAQAARNLGLGLMRIGMADEACPYLEQAMESNTPWSPLAMASLADLEAYRGDHQRAFQIIRNLIGQSDPLPMEYRYSTFRSFVSYLIRNNQIDEAAGCLAECESVPDLENHQQIEILIMRLQLVAARNSPKAVRKIFNTLPDAEEISPDDQQMVMRCLRDSGMTLELRYFARAVFENNPMGSLTNWLAVFHLMFQQLRIHAGSHPIPVLRQIMDLIGGDLHSCMPFHTRMINRVLTNMEFRFLLNNIIEDDFGNLVEKAGKILVQVATRTLVPDNFHFTELETVFAESIELLADDLNPWPADNRCKCGENIRDHVFCDCGNRFEELPDDFFRRIPTSRLTCVRCGERFPGFKCDACGLIYSWLLG